jgi:hypothetical protein
MGGTCCRHRREDQVARALLSMPWFMVNNVLRAVNDAEDRLGRIPTTMEIYHMFRSQNNRLTANNPYEIGAILMSMYREDLILSDDVAYQFTTRQHEGFNTFSVNFNKKYKGYGICKTGNVVPITAKTISFKKQIEMLKSTDPSQLELARWTFDGDFRFLDGESIGDNKVGFTSFPRSGNSFMRRILEQISGITTGGTMHLHTATSLQIQGLKGEWVFDDKVWIVKSHHPFIIPNTARYQSNKVLFCVRNPMDVFPSYASFVNTMNHGVKPDYDYEVRYPEWWDWWIKFNTKLMKQFFEVILNHLTKESKILFRPLIKRAFINTRA